MKLTTIITLLTLLNIAISTAQEGNETITVYPTVAAYNKAKGRDEGWRGSDNTQRLPNGVYEVTLTIPKGAVISMALDYPGPDETIKEGAKDGEKYIVTIEPRKFKDNDIPFSGCRGIYFGDPKGVNQPFEVKVHYKKTK